MRSTFCALFLCFAVLRLTACDTPDLVESLLDAQITSPAKYLIDSDLNRDHLSVQATVDFTIQAAQAAVGSYVVLFQLLDGAGDPVPLEGTTAPEYGRFSVPQDLALDFIVNPAESRVFLAELVPSVTLDAADAYRVRATLYLLCNDIPVSLNQQMESATRQLIHFTNTVSGDPEVNARAEILDLQFAKAWALAHHDSQKFIEANLAFRLYRYDDFNSAPHLDAISLAAQYFLRESGTGTVVASGQQFFSSSLLSHGGGVPKVPASGDFQVTLSIEPESQLDAVNKTYYLEVWLQHRELSGGPYAVDDILEGFPATLAHFNGSLRFGTIQTTFTEIGNNPSVFGVVIGAAFDCDLVIGAGKGFLQGHPEYTFGNGVHLLKVSLLANGLCVLRDLPGNQTTAYSPAFPGLDSDIVQGIRFDRGSAVTLDANGATASILVHLPPGLGWSPTPGNNILLGEIDFGPLPLQQNLAPLNDPTLLAAHVVEESKPVELTASNLTWKVGQGLFTSTNQSAAYLRADELTYLEAAPAVVNRKKKSNEGFYRALSATMVDPSAEVRTGAGGGAELSTKLFLAAGSFTTHFPQNVTVTWSANLNPLVIEDDLIDPSASHLDGVSPLSLAYAQGCSSVDCGDPEARQGSLTMSVTGGRLDFTRDGGLLARGTLTGTEKHLEWGFIDSGTPRFAHATGDFTAAEFLVCGHFLRGDQTSLDRRQTAGVVHYSGFGSPAPDNPGGLERPHTTRYQDGYANYAGMNVRVFGESLPFPGESTLAGEIFGPYELTNRCKYYTRRKGVTGIHEAEPGSFPASAMLYGYTVTFTQFGFNFLDSLNLESRTNGAIAVQYPSAFSQEFEELQIDCLGGLLSAEVTDGGDLKNLVYWNADFSVLALEFAKDEAAACDPGTGFLKLGVEAWSSHVPEPLHGSWAFQSNGNLITRDDGLLAGFDSRLALPESIALSGPNGESYYMMPVTDAYLNNFDYHPAPEGTLGQGFINFALTVDLPFFIDLEVHFHTTPKKDNTTAPIHLTGGFEQDGLTFFTHQYFDPDNRGFPAGKSVSEYRELADFWPIAKKDWLGVVALRYPLEWNGTTRTFRSAEPISNKLMVLTTEHEVLYLSPENAELSFGLVYAGLPKINLSNALLNTLDENTGVLSALTNAASSQVTDALTEGTDRLADLLSDQADALFAAALDAALDPVLEAFIAKLEDDYDPDLDYFASGAQVWIDQYILDNTNGVLGKLATVQGAVSDAAGLLYEVDQNLAWTQAAIRSIVDNLETTNGGKIIIDPDLGEPVLNTIPGIFSQDGQGEYQIVPGLVYNLLNAFVPDIASQLTAILPLDELNTKVNALLADSAGSIEQIKDALLQLHEIIGEIRTATKPGGELLAEVDDLFGQAIGAGKEFEQITTGVAQEIADFLESMDPAANGVTFLEYTKAEIKDRLRKEIHDRFYATTLVRNIQLALKQRIYDLNSSITEAVDSAFAQLNLVLRDLLGEALGAIDDKINGFTDDLASTVGGAQIDGYAHINGDSLKKLRLDIYLQLKVPDDMEFHGYVQICELDSEGEGGCSYGGAPATEVSLGALGLPILWIGSEIKLDVGCKFTFGQVGDTTSLRGMGGFIAMTEGEISFQTFKITEFAAAVAFGLDENYLAAKVGVIFDGYEMAGGIFFGRTCTLDPIAMVDPDVAAVLGTPPFTGAYVYGEVYMPIFNYSCLFRVSAGVGAGAFYFLEGPTYGGKIKLAAGGEVLCLLEAKGSITMVGAKSGDTVNFLGKGEVYGRVGWCPICVEFNKTATATYKNNKWDVQY